MEEQKQEPKQEKKQSAYEDFVRDYQSLATYASVVNRVKKGEYVEELSQLAATAVPENLQPEREIVLRLDPKNDVTALLNWVYVGYNKSAKRVKEGTKDNLEAIVNDTNLKEEVLLRNIQYMQPNDKIEDKNYKEIIGLHKKAMYMGMINEKIFNKKELNEQEKGIIMKECVEFYKEIYNRKEDADILNALVSLANYSETLRSMRFIELSKENAKEFTDKVKVYNIRKYAIDSIKGNEDKNDNFFAAIAGLNQERGRPKEDEEYQERAEEE